MERDVTCLVFELSFNDHYCDFVVRRNTGADRSIERSAFIGGVAEVFVRETEYRMTHRFVRFYIPS